MVSFYYAGKLLIQLLLFALFLIFFGLPSYHRYHQKGVLVKTDKSSMKGLELPAVTICPRCFQNDTLSLACGTNDSDALSGVQVPQVGGLEKWNQPSGTYYATNVPSTPTTTQRFSSFSSLKIKSPVKTQRCIRETTFNLTELVEDAWLENPVAPTAEKPNLMLEERWRPDFTLTWYGTKLYNDFNG